MDGELKKKLKVLEKEKQKARGNNDLAELAKLYNVCGEHLAEYRLYEDAIEEHKMELHVSERLNDDISVAIAHRKIGECLCELKDFKQALHHQQTYVNLSRKCENLVEEQRALATIGRTLFQSATTSSEMLEAQSAFVDSLSICNKLEDTVKEKELLEMKARLYLNLGLVNSNLHNQKKAMKYIEKSLTIAVNQNLKDTEYRCHFSLGEIKIAENLPAQALQCFEHARNVAKHQGIKFEEIDTLVQMAKMLLHLGDFKAAKNILKKCYKTTKNGTMVDELRSNLIRAIKGSRLLDKLTHKKDDNIKMKVHEELGDVYCSVNCFDKAIDNYHKQLELSEKLDLSKTEKAVICVSLAQSYLDNKQFDKAKEYFHKELLLRTGEELEQCDTWCNIANVSEMAGDSYEDIEMAYNNALKCARKCSNSNREQRVLKLLKCLKMKEDGNDYESKECIEIIEDDSESERSQRWEDDDEYGEMLIQEEMELSDSDDEEEYEKSSSIVKLGRRHVNSMKRNEKGETRLHVAAIRGDYNLAKTSINKGVSVHSRDYCGWQPLHEACNHGNLAIVELLLDEGADINDPGGAHCRGMTPLHDAAQNGHVDVVKLLVERGACVSKCNNDGKTPFNLVLSTLEDKDSDDEDTEDTVDTLNQLIHILQNANSSIGDAKETSSTRRRDKMLIFDDSDSESSQEIISRHVKNHKSQRKNTLELNEKKRKANVLVSDEELNACSDEELNSCSDKIVLTQPKCGVYQDNMDFTETSCDLLNIDEEEFNCNSMNDSPSSSIFLERNSSCYSSSVTNNNLHKNTTSERGTPANNSSREAIDLSSVSSASKYLDPVTGSTQRQDNEVFEPALISEEEYLTNDIDNWLIHDYPIKSGKRKRSGNILSMRSHSHYSHDTNKRVNGNTKPTHSTSQTRSKPRLRQSRLNVVSGLSSHDDFLEDVSSPRKSSSFHGVPVSSNPPMRIRVKVNKRTFLIPCPNDPQRKTIKWLAEQAVFRYHSATGLKPCLSLCTTEGATLSSHDFIVDVLSNNELVNATVESWQLAPLSQRYREACSMLNKDISPVIVDVLDKNDHLSNVEFKDKSLTSSSLQPLFRCLQCHESLVRLSLPGNRMGDKGVEFFVSCLSSFPNLSSLVLSCNGITHKGLHHLAATMNSDDEVCHSWSNLKELDLSFNTISDLGSSDLASLLCSAPQLQVLGLSSTSLGDCSFHQRSTLTEAIQNLRRLRFIDVSFNIMSCKILSNILRAVKYVETINISSTAKYDSFLSPTLIEHLEADNTIVKVICRGYNFTPKEIQSMRKTKRIFTSQCQLVVDE
ncbi:tonsoku-like protein [Xenia sp. Carnegie-2017]|uniref:tonsoku-like protein n=1 Tax=Xenia sp. Carnegie-2017 TaxID=2897299 RepID=UPI001F048ED9|nr:tonsoku-like protein [Xenia sp. Carnegie-2017]